MRFVVVIGVVLAALAPGKALAVSSAWASRLSVDVGLLEDVESLLGAPLLQADRPAPDKKSSGSSSSSGSDGPATSTATNLAPAGAYATPQGRQFGIGLELGYPVALIIKYMLKSDQGIAAGIGAFSGFVYDRSSVTVFVDYLVHPHLLTAGEAFALTWYIGGGGQLIINDRFSSPYVRGVLYPGFYYGSPFWLAARVPIGVNLALTQAPLEVFLEGVPSILVFPALSFGIGASIGLRFYL